nr:hypothetical protein [Tanacetum cinerariifolium]
MKVGCRAGSLPIWPYKLGTFRETLVESTEGTPQFGPERPRVYSDLNFEAKDRYNSDIWATNILLQGLQKDIYTLINHYTDAKDIWDNVKMLLDGPELTKEDRESQLYDDFEHFRQHKEESIHDYYVRMGRFVTAVKLNRRLRDSNYDQLFAYLKQHKAHAKENKMMLERLFQPTAQPTADPLALLSNASYTQHGLPSSSTSSFTQLPLPRANSSSSADDLSENLTSTLGMNPRGGSAAGYGKAQNRVRNVNQGQARPGQARTVKCYNCNGTGHIARNCTQPKRPQNSEYFKDKMLLMHAQENRVALDAEQLLFLEGGQDNAFDDDVDEQSVQDLALNVDNVFQAEDYDAFDSDVDEPPTAQTMFMANLSSADPITDEAGPSYDLDTLSEVQDHDQYLDDTCAYHEEHVMHESVQLDHGVDLHADYTSVSNMILYDQYVKDNEETLAESTEGTPQFGPERPRVYSDLNTEEKDRYNADIRATNISLQGLPKDIYTLINHYTDAKDIWDNVKMLLDGSELTNEDRESQLYDDFEHFRQHKEESIHDYYFRVVVQNVQGRPNRCQGMNPQGGSAAGYEEAQNRVGNVNQGQARPGQARTMKCYNYNGGQDNAFDDDVDEQPVQDLALNVDNVFQAEDCDAFDSDIDDAPTAQTMFMANLSSADPITDEAGPSYVSDILSEYVKDSEVPVVHSNASSVPNDTFMMIYNDMCEPSAPSMSNTSWNASVKTSLTAELATYREQVELYERQAKFKLTEREQKINEQLRLVISDRNFKEETLKRELHSTKLKLASTINRNKSMVAIGYKNPLCLTRAKQAQPALYSGHEILKDNHAPAKLHNTKDTLEIAEITRKKMNAKMIDPECVTHKVKIAPHDYSKENLLDTFTPQKQLTPKQIYWKHDGIDRKNLLIANDNLIAECLSKEVFYVVTKSELNVARFAEMHVTNTSVEARCLAFEADLATLRDKSHQENQGELIKHFSKLK